MGRILVLMAKQPAAGKTKTRLTPYLSPGDAARLYHCFLQDKVTAMQRVSDIMCAIAYTPAEAEPFFRELAPEFKLILQQGADLQARLKHVFTSQLEAGFKQVVAIDGDSVTLPHTYFEQAFSALDDDNCDVSLGATEDGGYYAIGMKAPHLTVFDVEMSTPNVTRDTLARAAEAKLKVTQLPTWYDIDHPEDLQRLATELKDQPNTPTRQFLVELGEIPT